MHPHRNRLLAACAALLLVLTGCASEPSGSDPGAPVADTSTPQGSAPEQSPDSAAPAGAADTTIPPGASAASAEFPFPVPEGWAVLHEFTEEKVGKQLTMGGSVEYPGEAKDAAATYLRILKEAGFDASTYAPGELTNQASLVAEGAIQGTHYVVLLNFDVHADGHQHVSIIATPKG